MWAKKIKEVIKYFSDLKKDLSGIIERAHQGSNKKNEKDRNFHINREILKPQGWKDCPKASRKKRKNRFPKKKIN